MSKHKLDRGLGAFPSQWDYRTYRVASPTAVQVAELPKSYIELLDYAPDGKYGDPNREHPDQGQVGSCVGHDAAIVLEISNNIEDKGFRDLSAWWAYHRSRAYSFPPIPSNVEGSTNFGAVKAMNHEGCVPETSCPTPKSNISFNCFTEENRKLACNWAIDQYWNINPQPNDVKGAIYGITHEMPYKMPDSTQGKTALMSAYPVYDSFEDSYSDGIVPMPKSSESLRGGHSSAIVGWKLIDGDEYYVNYNSWGENIGDDGLFYIPVQYPFYPNDFYLIHNGPPTNQPDPIPSGCSVGNNVAKFLNLFIGSRRGKFHYLNAN